MTIKQLRRTILEHLAQHGIESPEVESGLIVAHVLGISRTELITRDGAVSDAAAITANAMARRRINGEPIQYITGRCEFMSLEFAVDRNTLIPRPETELLVETVISKVNLKINKPQIWDIGCGSGCIGLSLAHYIRDAHVLELDNSPGALETAKRNAEKFGVSDRVVFLEHNILTGMPGRKVKPDCIVSNPPYIPSKDIKGLQTEVRDFEPLTALDGGENGLIFYRSIIEYAEIKAGGLLAFEIGIGQADDVAALLHRKGYQEIEILPDLAGIDRVVTAIA